MKSFDGRDLIINQIEPEFCQNIPDHMKPGAFNYVMYGIPPGEFLYRVLCNDFFRACNHADHDNANSLFTYKYFLAELDPRSWGNESNVQWWINVGGEVGLRDG